MGGGFLVGTPTSMDDDPQDELWLAQLLAETGPQGADLIAEALGIDLNDQDDP